MVYKRKRKYKYGRRRGLRRGRVVRRFGRARLGATGKSASALSRTFRTRQKRGGVGVSKGGGWNLPNYLAVGGAAAVNGLAYWLQRQLHWAQGYPQPGGYIVNNMNNMDGIGVGMGGLHL